MGMKLSSTILDYILVRKKFNSREMTEGEYKEGKFMEYYADGQIKRREFYRNGKPEEEQKYWHENGHLNMQWFFVNGVLSGNMKEWNTNGRIKESINYLNNGWIGDHRQWNNDGSVWWRVYHFNGGRVVSFDSKNKLGIIYLKYKLKCKTLANLDPIFTEFLISDLVLEIVKWQSSC